LVRKNVTNLQYEVPSARLLQVAPVRDSSPGTLIGYDGWRVAGAASIGLFVSFPTAFLHIWRAAQTRGNRIASRQPNPYQRALPYCLWRTIRLFIAAVAACGISRDRLVLALVGNRTLQMACTSRVELVRARRVATGLIPSVR
jgi:hypothetical protein